MKFLIIIVLQIFKVILIKESFYNNRFENKKQKFEKAILLWYNLNQEFYKRRI